MRNSQVAISLFAVLAFVVPANGAGKPNGLSVAIVIPKGKSGVPTIDREGTFQIVFTNRSDKPIRLWSEECQHSLETLSFRVEDGDVLPSVMSKRTPSPSAWKNRWPKTVTIAPGETLSWDVGLSAFNWGQPTWKGAPEPNTGKQVTLTAVFEIKSAATAKEEGIWTGRVTSEPIKTLVVDAKLRTPHEYLWAGCPKQALRIMQAEKTWIKKEDDNQCTPLHHATRFDYSDVARWLLSNGADVNAEAYNGFTPLHLAGNPEMVKLLIEHKADVNTKSNGRSPLETAAGNYAEWERNPDWATDRENARKITKILLAAGAEYDIRSACYLNDYERVRVLVADKKHARNKEALCAAAGHGRVKIVKLFLEKGADPEDADYGGLTVSYVAIGHADVLKLLFDAGADPKVRVQFNGTGRGPQGSTLLHEAAAGGYLESVKLLVARGVDVNLKNSSGTTPLHEACRYGHAPTVEWLIRNGADAKANTKEGLTPMSAAASQVWPERDEENARYQAVIRALARAGVELDVFAAISCNDVQRVAKILQANPKIGDAKTLAGCPALHRAVSLDRKEIVKLLLDKGANPNVESHEEGVGYEGETALLQAAFWGRLEMAEMLLKAGANANAKASKGVVPLHEAARMGHLELARLLLTKGAEVNAKDENGRTPLDWAGSYKQAPRMNKLLRDHGGME